MATETPVQPTPIEQQAPPLTPEVNEAQTNTAPNIDGELDDALNKAFSSSVEQKPIEPTTKVEKKIEKNEPKEVVKSEQTQKPVEGELPNPETLAENAPKKQDGWTALKNNYKRAHKILSEKDQEIQKLKAVVAEKGSLSTKEIEDLKNEIQELSKYRTVVDIQADPEFISKYEAPIEKSKASIKEMLLSMQVSENIVDQLDFANTKLMDEIIGHVAEHRDKIVARKLQRKIEEVTDLMDKREEVLSEKKSSYKDFIENKKKESFSRSAEEEGRMIRHIESVSSKVPFLSKREPGEGASEGEMQQIEHHNKVVDLMNVKLKQAMSATTPEDRAEVAIAAVASHYFNAELKSLRHQNLGLQEELKKISAIGSETEKTKVKVSSRNGNGPVDVDAALKAHFAK